MGFSPSAGLKPDPHTWPPLPPSARPSSETSSDNPRRASRTGGQKSRVCCAPRRSARTTRTRIRRAARRSETRGSPRTRRPASPPRGPIRSRGGRAFGVASVRGRSTARNRRMCGCPSGPSWIFRRTCVALQLLDLAAMANDFEQLLRDVFGNSVDKLMQFQGDQLKRLQTKLQEMAREAVKDDLTKLHTEVAELRARVATLESERARAAADSIQSSF